MVGDAGGINILNPWKINQKMGFMSSKISFALGFQSLGPEF